MKSTNSIPSLAALTFFTACSSPSTPARTLTPHTQEARPPIERRAFESPEEQMAYAGLQRAEEYVQEGLTLNPFQIIQSVAWFLREHRENARIIRVLEKLHENKKTRRAMAYVEINEIRHACERVEKQINGGFEKGLTAKEMKEELVKDLRGYFVAMAMTIDMAAKSGQPSSEYPYSNFCRQISMLLSIMGLTEEDMGLQKNYFFEWEEFFKKLEAQEEEKRQERLKDIQRNNRKNLKETGERG